MCIHYLNNLAPNFSTHEINAPFEHFADFFRVSVKMAKKKRQASRSENPNSKDDFSKQDQVDWYAGLHTNALHYYDREYKTRHASAVDLEWFDLSQLHREDLFATKKRRKRSANNDEPHSTSVKGSSAKEELFVPLYRFWLRRHLLWNKFDQGILMDTTGWYSVTPELIARQQVLQTKALLFKQSKKQAEDDSEKSVSFNLKGFLVWDGFVGVGGNAVAWCKECGLCLGSDINAERLAMAAHNVKNIYKMPNLELLQMDFRQVKHVFRKVDLVDLMFISPPWGGPSYNKATSSPINDNQDDEFDVEHRLQLGDGYNGASLYADILVLCSRVISFLPRKTSLPSYARVTHNNNFDYREDGDGEEWVLVESNWIDKSLKGITIYHGFE